MFSAMTLMAGKKMYKDEENNLKELKCKELIENLLDEMREEYPDRFHQIKIYGSLSSPLFLLKNIMFILQIPKERTNDVLTKLISHNMFLIETRAVVKKSNGIAKKKYTYMIDKLSAISLAYRFKVSFKDNFNKFLTTLTNKMSEMEGCGKSIVRRHSIKKN